MSRTGVPTGTSGNSAATSSGYMRMQPCVTASPTAIGLFVPWIKYVPLPAARRIAYAPSGLSGPGGTLAGNGSPAAACSLRTDSGGYQVGSFCFAMTCVTPSGVRQSILPMLTG